MVQKHHIVKDKTCQKKIGQNTKGQLNTPYIYEFDFLLTDCYNLARSQHPSG